MKGGKEGPKVQGFWMDGMLMFWHRVEATAKKLICYCAWNAFDVRPERTTTEKSFMWFVQKTIVFFSIRAHSNWLHSEIDIRSGHVYDEGMTTTATIMMMMMMLMMIVSDWVAINITVGLCWGGWWACGYLWMDWCGLLLLKPLKRKQ